MNNPDRLARIEFERRIRRAANKTWNAIGDDVLRAKGDCKSLDEVDYTVEMSRDEVVGCVFDFIVSHGELTSIDAALWRELPHTEKIDLVNAAFAEHERYGW
jgi:hypothetical protein